MGEAMSQIYHQLFYHVVWATKYRRAMISEEVERVLFPYLENKAKRFHCVLHGINGIGNHVHVAMSIPPSVSISEIVGKLKGSSSYFLNRSFRLLNTLIGRMDMEFCRFRRKICQKYFIMSRSKRLTTRMEN